MAGRTSKHQNNNDKKKARQAEQERKAKAQKRNKTYLRIAAAVLAAALVCVLVLNTNFVRSNATAVTVDGTELSVIDYNFYFYRSYYEYINKMGTSTDGIDAGLQPAENIPLSKQFAYRDENGREVTWQNYFDNRAISLINRTFTYYAMAQTEGFALTQAQEDDIQYDFDEKIWFEAEEINQITVNAYLKQLYGKGMTEEIYKENLRILYTANFYEEYYKSTITIPDSALDAAYSANADNYEIIQFRLFYLSGKTASGDNMPQAKSRADQLAASAQTEMDFITLCEEYQSYNDENSFWQNASELRRSQVRYAIPTLQPWLSVPERASGDVGVIEATNGYYVVWYGTRYANDYTTVNLKYFTISDPESIGKAAAKAEEFLQTWQAGEATTDSLFELAKDYRDIDYSKQNHKIDVISYYNADKSSVPLPMIDWCFAEPRSVGDVGVFRAFEENCVYVAYFDGYGQLSSRNIVFSELQKEQFEAWKAEVLAENAVKKEFFFFLTS